MNKNTNAGFSLVELLLVVVIIGIIAALAVPSLMRAAEAAENGSTFSTMRTIASTQVSFYSQNSRFGRLAELNPLVGNSLGTVTGDRLVRGAYTFEMNPVTPIDDDLKSEYVVTATKTVGGTEIYKYELTESGVIEQVLP